MKARLQASLYLSHVTQMSTVSIVYALVVNRHVITTQEHVHLSIINVQYATVRFVLPVLMLHRRVVPYVSLRA